MNNPSLSTNFYHYLCDVIGTEDVVNMRRHIFTSKDNTDSETDYTCLSSGSKAEGLDLAGSDFDVMLLYNFIPVYENASDVPENLFDKYPPFVMDTSSCKPGYTQLKQYNLNKWHHLCEYKAGVGYLSSTYMRDSHGSPEFIPHGPCNTTSDGYIDIAFCLRCSYWISKAKPWILRSRNVWTSNNVIDTIFKFGVLFVPVGCKNSPNIDTEWRISFSYAEKLLIWSFNHVQLLCYALLKILLKDTIKQTTGDLLCSYFLKTIMLWICEETTSSKWEANTILSCFMACFNRLIYCVEYKTCAHYFIPENDLFAERFDRNQHKLLLFTLKQLRSFGWTCLLKTKTLTSFTGLFTSGKLSIIPRVSYVPDLEWLNRYCSPDGCKQFRQSVYFCMRSNIKAFYIYTISMFSSSIGQNLLQGHRRLISNKQLYNIYRKRLCHLLIGVNHVVASEWMLLASFFYANKQYKVCNEILLHCVSWCMRNKISLTCIISNRLQTCFTLLDRTLYIKPIDMIKNHIIDIVSFTPLSQILPEEIKMLHDEIRIDFPFIAFGLFLKFLCYHHLCNQREKDKSFQQLKNVIRIFSSLLTGKKKDNAHRILSIAYSMKDD